MRRDSSGRYFAGPFSVDGLNLESVIERSRTPRTTGLKALFDATIERVYGGYSSAAERLTVAQDVAGSIPASRPIYNALRFRK